MTIPHCILCLWKLQQFNSCIYMYFLPFFFFQGWREEFYFTSCCWLTKRCTGSHYRSKLCKNIWSKCVIVCGTGWLWFNLLLLWSWLKNFLWDITKKQFVIYFLLQLLTDQCSNFHSTVRRNLARECHYLHQVNLDWLNIFAGYGSCLGILQVGSICAEISWGCV